MFYKKGIFKNFTKFTGKTCARVSLLKKRLWHRRFPVSFVKFLRAPFLTEHLWWLLLIRQMDKGHIWAIENNCFLVYNLFEFAVELIPAIRKKTETTVSSKNHLRYCNC